MTTRSVTHILLVVLVLAGAGRRALAQGPLMTPKDEQAQRLSDEGIDLYRAGLYEEAKQRFKDAYALRAEPTLLYNLARTFEKLGDADQAVEYYRRYLVAEGTDPKLREKAEQKIRKMTQKMTQKEPAPARPTPPPKPPTLFESKVDRKLFWPGIGLAAGGVAGIGIGVVLYVLTAQEFVTFRDSGDESEKRAAKNRAAALGNGSIAGYAAGGALLAGGAALILVSMRSLLARKGAERKLSLLPLPGGAGLSLGGSF